jgi:uncharacterized iron-regulated protein
VKQTLLLFAACLITIGCASLPGHFISLETESVVPFEYVLEEIGNERVIFVGEMHGDRKSHTVEFEVLKYLHERGDDFVIAFEMFPHTEQTVLDKWVDGTIDERQFIGRYHRIVNMPFRTYKNILRYARSNGIPVVGINADKTLISNVSKGGIKNVSSSVLEKIKFQKCSDDDSYSRIMGFSKGKQYHKSQMDFLCDGQRLRDAHMAYHIARVLKSRDVKVVVMTGILHAIKVAVPDMLQDHLPVSYRVLMPAKVQQMIETGNEAAIADYLWY